MARRMQRQSGGGRLWRVWVAVASCALAGHVAFAQISPPPGPITPTGRKAVNATNTPGDSTCLFKITQAGSYYLTGPIDLPDNASTNGIVIAAPDVTLDLNGFRIRGDGRATSLSGIFVADDPGFYHLVVRNGVIRDWGHAGIDATHSRAAHFSELRIGVNGLNHDSTDKGGLTTGTGCTVVDCEIWGNGGGGLIAGDWSTVNRCTTHMNHGAGIKTGQYCTVSQCTSSNNDGSQGHGIWLTSGGDGSGSTAVDCTASFNIQCGLLANNGCTISRCTAFQNGDAGISVGIGCSVTGNTCGRSAGPAGTGIRATGSGNRIEDNTTNFNATGFDISGVKNLVIRNRTGGDAVPYSIGTGNTYGEIINNDGTASVVLSGGTVSAWANFKN